MSVKENGMVTSLKYLLISALSVSLYSYAAPATLSGDDLDLGLSNNSDLFQLAQKSFFLANEHCFSLMVVPCYTSLDYSPLFESNGELYLGNNGYWFPVQHLYITSLSSNEITTFYLNENVQAASEIPLPNVGFLLFSVTSILLARVRRNGLKAKNN